MSFSKYETTDIINSPYCYKDSEILINKLNITNAELLKEAEIAFVTQRNVELYEMGITGRFSITHFTNIHKYIFGDLYPFAGHFRTENISKGNTMFCDSNLIEQNIKNIILTLKKEKYLKNLPKDIFCDKLAYYFANLNIVHPYRDGNGRAIREFIRQLCLYNNYNINWVAINPKTMLDVMIASVNDINILATYLKKIIKKI